MIGRERELAELEAAALDGAGVLIAGPAGVGKSFLVAGFLEALERRRYRVERFVASPNMQRVPLSAVARVAHTIDGAGATDLALTAAAIAASLAEDAPNRRSIVLFDDAHLLDASSLLVVQELALQASVTVLLTVRTGETIPDSILSLWRAGTLKRIDVEPLERDDADQLAESCLRGSAAEDLRLALWEQSAGIPLYIRESIHDAMAEGVVLADGPVWRLSEPLRLGRRMNDLLRHRIERLDPDERALVELVATAEPIHVELLAAAEQASAISLERRGILQWDDPVARRMLRPGHPLLGEVARANTTMSRVNDIVADLAGRLLANELPLHGAALRLASATRGLQLRLPGKLFVMAAREALAAFAPDEARWLAERAVEIDPSADAHHVLGEVYQLGGDTDRGEQHLIAASVLTTDDSQLVRIAHNRANIHAYIRSDPHAAISILRQTAHRLKSADARLSLRAETAMIAALLGDFPDVLRLGVEILATEGLPDETRSTTLGNICYAQSMLIELDRFDENWQQAIDLLKVGRLAEKPTEFDLLWAIRSSVMIERGDFVSGYAVLEKHLRDCEAGSVYRGIAELVRGHMLIIKGEVAARDAVRASIEQFGQMDPFASTVLARAAGALTAALAGDGASADAFLHGLNRDAFVDDPRIVAWLGRAQSARLALDGKLDEGAELAAETGRMAVKRTQVGWGTLAMHDAVRLGRPELVADELVDALGETGADYMEALARHASVSADSDIEGLRDIAKVFGRMGAWLHAGEAWLDASHVADDTAGQRTAIVHAQLIARQCTLRVWPRWQTVEPVLSKREVDVAVLAIDGLASKDIADRLFVSTRTVENHLGRIYRSLDLDGRPGLVGAFGAFVRPARLPSD